MFLKVKKITKQVFNTSDELNKNIKIEDVLGKYLLIEKDFNSGEYEEKDELEESKKFKIDYVEISCVLGVERAESRELWGYEDSEGVWISEDDIS